MFKLIKLFKPNLFITNYCTEVVRPLRPKKLKSTKNIQPQHFLDTIKVHVCGGNGGDGNISFLHLWCNEHGGPGGGDGGHGGHVIFKASTQIKDLTHVPTVIRAENGQHGGSKNCDGKNAKHTIVPVPLGTIVKRVTDDVVIGDLNKDGVLFIAARGGAGGKGNKFFVTDQQQAPQIAEYGAKGEFTDYHLEIRCIADFGLIGYPNSGKSTLLKAITRSRTKVASYAFTTLYPQLGTVQFSDHERIDIADLPGLIEDAHKNKGLGFRFLRHIERCQAVIYVLDVANENYLNYYYNLRRELQLYNNDLLKKEAFIVANKTDLLEKNEQSDIVKDLQEKTQLKVIPISAKFGINLLEFLTEIKKLYDKNSNKD